MSEKPCISIIMPVYNAEKYLKEIFQCILNQSYQKWELIAVDDCSKDKSGKICDIYAEKDSRIRVIHLQKNSGAGNARNQGIFSVTAIFLTNFLTNMPKIQKIHFFLMLIYIIIKRVYGAGGQPAGVTRPEMCRVTRPVRAGMGKRFRKRCRCPGKSRNTPPACRAETDKRGKDTWSTKYG